MKSFSKRQTQIMKGIAIVLLLVHHGLDPIPKENMGAFSGIVENSISLSKLCVAIFAILSGYGMYLSFQGKRKERGRISIWRFTFSHILKLYAVFWLAALLSIGTVALVKGNFGEIYKGYPLYYVLLDIMGLSYLTGSPKFVNSWWYVTAALIYYLLFPLAYQIVRRLKQRNYILVVLLAAVTFLYHGMNSISVYGCCFVYGMILAERNLLNRFLNSFHRNRNQIWLKEAGCLLAFILLCVFRQKVLGGTRTEYYLDWLITIVLMLLVGEVSEAPHKKKLKGPGLLEVIGRYSFEIYLIHAMFIKYFGEYVYLSEHCLAVWLRLFIASFAAAVLVKWLERVLGFPRIVAWCQRTRGKRVGYTAGMLSGVVVILLIPIMIANMGIGKLTFYKEEITMESGTWNVPLYLETPVFWELANKKYSSQEWDMVSFVDGVLYSHYEGQTKVTVSLPSGKSASCMVTVE